VASKGLEEALVREVEALPAKVLASGPGGVSFEAELPSVYRALLRLRTATRVLLTVAEFAAADGDALYEKALEVPWPHLFDRGRSFLVEATSRDTEAFRHSLYAAQKVKDAVADRFRRDRGGRPDVNLREPDVRIHARIVAGWCTLSLDLSGKSMNRRGYRTDPSEAPLRETTAAGLVLLSGWDGRSPLVDPACGAGTIAVEAALFAARIAPGLLSGSFAVSRLAFFDEELWERTVREEGKRALPPPPAPLVFASDRSEGEVRKARENARNAGVGKWIRFSVCDVADLEAPSQRTGTLLLNPPYGVRLPKEGEEAAPFYRALGTALRERFPGWVCWLLSGNALVTRELHLKASRRIPLWNGPIECRLLRYEVRPPGEGEGKEPGGREVGPEGEEGVEGKGGASAESDGEP
jgi:putative N6-adenine-specific DNA methylase